MSLAGRLFKPGANPLPTVDTACAGKLNMVVPVAMKQYVVDELQPADHRKIAEYLSSHFFITGLDGIYWAILDDDVLNETQKSHRECGLFYLAIELTDTAVTCELLVRAKNKLRCDCIQYATCRQRDWMMDQVDTMIKNLVIGA